MNPARPRKNRTITVSASSYQEAYRIARRLQRDEDATPPLIATVQRRISAIKADQLKALQLRLFPELPDVRRAAPNIVVRSSVFGVVRRGKRARVTDMPVAAPQGLEIAITGWRLDQHDLDIWLEIMHAAGAV